eukprot:CAMPEP_0114997828 /NCGR_PEP_ID=MMETSP0216-20121206/15131_1 /TAXON_ID=223996 /ORGANISM="Protocruzia adherens, Strain Boccale" /LENGTH=131 /DNA_ID=CAMNT_0002362283 /DNA_START=277 /DNA_END=669 /DNA_ORIENTATION=-
MKYDILQAVNIFNPKKPNESVDYMAQAVCDMIKQCHGRGGEPIVIPSNKIIFVRLVETTDKKWKLGNLDLNTVESILKPYIVKAVIFNVRTDEYGEIYMAKSQFKTLHRNSVHVGSQHIVSKIKVGNLVIW